MATEATELVQGCAVLLVGFDFASKCEFGLRLDELDAAFQPDKFV